MGRNVGGVDKMVRIVLGLVGITLFFTMEAPVKYVGIFGFVFLITGLINFCPLYRIFGISTCRIKN